MLNYTLGLISLGFLSFLIPERLIDEVRILCRNLASRLKRQKPLEEAMRLYFLLSQEEFLFESSHELHYRWYGDFSNRLLALKREEGAQIRLSLLKLREVLKKDIRIQKNIQRIIKEGKSQVLIMIAISWLFCFILVIKGNSIKNSWLTLAFCYQLIGLVSYQVLINRKSQSFLKEPEAALKYLMSFLSLSSSGVSLNTLLKESCIADVSELTDKDLKVLKLEVMRLIDRLKERGESIDQGIEGIVDDILFLIEQRGEKLSSFFGFCQMLFAALFVLPVFLSLIFLPLILSLSQL